MKTIASVIAGMLFLGTSLAPGQSSGQLHQPADGGMREVLISIYIPSLPNAPFSATVNTEWIRQLADGSTITLKNHRAIARDGAGRIFQERRLLVPEDGKHNSPVTQIEISDPIAHELYICVPPEHTCQVEEFSTSESQHPSNVTAPKTLGAEDLGRKFIEGLETLGERQTMTIKPGAIGNDHPLSASREYWYSPQLGVNVISKRKDPRFGTQNFELSNIAVGEPDTTLFQVPADCEVIDLRNTPEIQPQVPHSN